MKRWMLNRFYEVMLAALIFSSFSNSFKAFADYWDDSEAEPEHISWETGRPDNLPTLEVVSSSCDCPSEL